VGIIKFFVFFKEMGSGILFAYHAHAKFHTPSNGSGYSKNGYSSGNDGTYSIELMD
jgi:hypothetical protein